MCVVKLGRVERFQFGLRVGPARGSAGLILETFSPAGDSIPNSLWLFDLPPRISVGANISI